MRKVTRLLWSSIALMIALLCMMVKSYMNGTLFSSGEYASGYPYLTVRTASGVKEMDLEEYVMGITAGEISAEAHPEARRAQMILVRTNLYKNLEDTQGELAQEPYWTMEQMEKEGVAAVFQEDSQITAGQVVEIAGTLSYLPFHKVSAGRTRSGQEALPGQGYDWLTSVPCDSDQESPDYLDIRIWNPDRLIASLEEFWPQGDQDPMEVIQVTKRDSADYVLSVSVGEKVLSGERFRRILGLPSACFYLEEVEEGIRITTKGQGHGLGLSQFQAELMAEAGAGYQDILSAFFAQAAVSSR